MHKDDEQVVERLRSQARPSRPDMSLTDEGQTGASSGTAERLSARLLPAPDGEHDMALLSLDGELDLATAPMLDEVLQPVFQHHTGPVVVDMSEVAFMDSTGVRMLLETHERLKTDNRRLAIVCLEDGQVHKLLRLVGLLDALDVHRTRESALVGGHDLFR